MHQRRLLQGAAVLAVLIVGFVLGISYEGRTERQEEERRQRRVETDVPLRTMLEEREVVAAWFGIPATQVIFREAPAECVPGGDRDWQVHLSGNGPSALTTPVITEGGLPSYIEMLPVPEDISISDAERYSSLTEGLSSEAAEAAKMMCFAVAKLLGIPTVTEDYIQVVEVRALGDSPRPETWVVTVSMETYPWRDLGKIRGNVQPTRSRIQGVAFNVD